MTKIKFVHTADLHLDTPFKGLSDWNGDLASRLRDATFHGFKKIIDLCLQEKVDFLIISGDVFDGENKSLAAQLKFVDELKRLSGKQIPVYFSCGNHDPLSSWMDSLQMPENVFRFGSDRVERYIYRKGDEPVAGIYGISYANKEVHKNLAREYPLAQEDASLVSIAVLHGTLGSPGPHANYAPFVFDDIAGKGFDYWALGHIHKHSIVRTKDPAVAYPGNPQGRDFGETGSRGCYLVEIEKHKTPEIRFVPVQEIRFDEITVDLTGKDEINSLPDRIEDAIQALDGLQETASCILRVDFVGRTRLHGDLNRPREIELLREHFNEAQLSRKHFTWIDRIEVKTKPAFDIEQIEKGSGFIAEVLRSFAKSENDPEKLDGLITNAVDDFSSHAVKREIELLEDEQREILEKAKWMLLDKLINEPE
ncbi:MAG: metallophosphoesterase [Bacteroidales bacterium]